MEELEKEIEDYNKKWKHNHPFLHAFDQMWYNCFGEDSYIAGWAPHQIFENPLGIMKDIGYEIKWAYQRVVNGVDERASWGVCYWLSETMPIVLGNVRGSKYGIPLTFFSETSPNNTDGNYSEIETKMAGEKYDEVIADIKWGFEEMQRLENVQILGDGGIGLPEYQRRQKLAKDKMKLLIDYYWEIGD